MPFDEDLMVELLELADHLPIITLGIDIDDLAVLAFCVEQVRKSIEVTPDSHMAAFAVGKIAAMGTMLEMLMTELAVIGRAKAAEAN